MNDHNCLLICTIHLSISNFFIHWLGWSHQSIIWACSNVWCKPIVVPNGLNCCQLVTRVFIKLHRQTVSPKKTSCSQECYIIVFWETLECWWDLVWSWSLADIGNWSGSGLCKEATPIVYVVLSPCSLSQSVDVWQSISQFETQFLPLQLFIQAAAQPPIHYCHTLSTPATNQQPLQSLFHCKIGPGYCRLACQASLKLSRHICRIEMPANWGAPCRWLNPISFTAHSIAAACFQPFSSSLLPPLQLMYLFIFLS